jgi:hypothetical protein
MDRAQHPREDLLAGDLADQLHLRGRQVDVGRDEVEVLGRCGAMTLADVVPALDQQVVDRDVEVVGVVDAEPDRQGALRVEVDEQHLAAVFGQRRAQVDRGRRLADAALLVAHRDDPRRAVPPGSREGDGRSVRPWCLAVPRGRSGGVTSECQRADHSIPLCRSACSTDRGDPTQRVGEPAGVSERGGGSASTPRAVCWIGHHRVDLRRRHRRVARGAPARRGRRRRPSSRWVANEWRRVCGETSTVQIFARSAAGTVMHRPRRSAGRAGRRAVLRKRAGPCLPPWPASPGRPRTIQASTAACAA